MITFDFETTNYSYGSALDPRNRILMVSWTEGAETNCGLWDNEEVRAKFFEAIDSAATLCAFNAKFEMLWFIRLGLDIDRWKWHDPMLAEKVMQGNRRVPFNLGDTAKRYGYQTKDEVIDKLMKAGVCPSEMPQKRLMARNIRDVRVTHSLYKFSLNQLKMAGQLHLYRTRCDFTVVLARMEHEGMLLDKQRVHTEYKKVTTELATVRAELDAMTGGINLRSPDQLAHYLYGTLKFPERKDRRGQPLRNKPSKQFPDGRPKTDQHTMAWLEKQATTSRQKDFIELRRKYGKLNAKLTKNLEFFMGVCEERDSHFHAQFNQTVAATHRLTSTGMPIQFDMYDKPKSVQLQNSPREYKRLYTAPEGYSIVEVDASQLEFRVAAFLGQDKQAMADISDPDFDAHCRSASVMFDIPYRKFLEQYRDGNKAYKEWRTMAKPDTFKPLYGGQRGTPEQEKWYKEFNERYSGIYATQENWLAEVSRGGSLQLPWGMTFFWKTRLNKRGVLLDAVTQRPVRPQVFNYPVQSLATAEIVPIAILSLYKRCREAGLDVKFVCTVHDSVICYVKEGEDMRRFHEHASLAFTQDVYDYLEMHYGINFNVPLGMELVYGKHWSEGKELIYDDVTRREQ